MLLNATDQLLPSSSRISFRAGRKSLLSSSSKACRRPPQSTLQITFLCPLSHTDCRPCFRTYLHCECIIIIFLVWIKCKFDLLIFVTYLSPFSLYFKTMSFDLFINFLFKYLGFMMILRYIK